MDPTPKIKIIHGFSEADPFLVVSKPPGLPSAPLKSGDDSALTRALALYPSLGKVRGKKPVECGLLHRLDTDAGGLLLIAASQEAYAALRAAQEAGRFIKGYKVRCQKLETGETLYGFPPCGEEAKNLPNSIKKYTVTSGFRFYGKGRKSVRPVTNASGRAAGKKRGKGEYTTDIFLDAALSARCYIRKGFRHQVRCHLAWLGYPAFGDKLYNPLYKAGDALEFLADYLSFPHPVTGEQIELSF